MAKEKPMRKQLPSQEMLGSLLSYCHESGGLFWKPRPRELFATESAFKGWNTKFANKPACNTKYRNGYLYGAIFAEHYLTHRIVYKLVTGQAPEYIDHIDGDCLNNTFINLRAVTQSENCKNSAIPSHNQSGSIGVCWNTSKKRWLAYFKKSGKTIHIGNFKDKEDAIAARVKASADFGFHANHGRQPVGQR